MSSKQNKKKKSKEDVFKMALSDVEVRRQIRHMISFIDQEATEKCEEIEAKSEEEFNLEKMRLVQIQRLKIKEHYDRKERDSNETRRIQSSNIRNHARIEILKYRESLIANLLSEVTDHLVKLTHDTHAYKDVLLRLILQGLFRLLEMDVILRARREDREIIESILPRIVCDYHEHIGRIVYVTVDPDEFLPSNIGGGVELIAQKGHLRIKNTLEARLDLIQAQLLPEIRVALFGKNPRRRFMD